MVSDPISFAVGGAYIWPWAWCVTLDCIFWYVFVVYSHCHIKDLSSVCLLVQEPQYQKVLNKGSICGIVRVETSTKNLYRR